MQIHVLGMHRSGTSVVTRLINLMGAYLGPEDITMGANADNPKGHWERHDVKAINDRLLASAGATWDAPLSYCEQGPSRDGLATFEREARDLLVKLDAHRPWVMKDPRNCLTLPHWLVHCDRPVFVAVIRHPLEVAASLEKRNHMPRLTGLALWELYTRRMAAHLADKPCTIVTFEDLIADPLAVARRLHEDLVDRGVRGLDAPDPRDVEPFVDPDLRHHRAGGQSSGRLNKQQQQLYEASLAGAFEDSALSTGARSQLARHGQFRALQGRLESQNRQLGELGRDLKKLQDAQAAQRAGGQVDNAMARGLESSVANTERLLGRLDALLDSLLASRRAELKSHADRDQARLSAIIAQQELKQAGDALKEIGSLRQQRDEALATIARLSETEAAATRTALAAQQEIRRLQETLAQADDEVERLGAAHQSALAETGQVKRLAGRAAQEAEAARAGQQAARREARQVLEVLDALKRLETRFQEEVSAIAHSLEEIAGSAKWRVGHRSVDLVARLTGHERIDGLTQVTGFLHRARQAFEAERQQITKSLSDKRGSLEARGAATAAGTGLRRIRQHLQGSPMILQMTPPDARNPYYRMLPDALAGDCGLDVRFEPDLEKAVGDAAGRGEGCVYWFHQFDPYYHTQPVSLARTKSRQARLLARLERIKAAGGTLVHTWHNRVPHRRDFLDVDLDLYTRLNGLLDLVIVHTRIGVDWIRSVCPAVPIRVLPHPSFEGLFGEPPTQGEARAALDWPEGRHTFLVFGEMKPYKNLAALARTWPRRDGDDRLVLLGAWPEGDPLKAVFQGLPGVTVEDRRFSDEELVRYVSAADGVLLTHHDIWVSGTAYASMSLGRPVVLPEGTGMQDTLNVGDHCVTYRLDDAGSLSRALDEVTSPDHAAHYRFMSRAWSRIYAPARLAPFYREAIEQAWRGELGVGGDDAKRIFFG